MATTKERISQAEEGVAQLQTVLDHTQSALAVAEQVEVAARKSRRWLKLLLVLMVVGIGVLIVRKMMQSDDGDSEDRSSAPSSSVGAGAGTD